VSAPAVKTDVEQALGGITSPRHGSDLMSAGMVRDITVDPLPPESVDVVVMNGVLTERQGIPRERMVTMAQSLLASAFQAARCGIVFNVMSRHVDWEREDLFHWGFDEVAAFLKQNLTRHFSFRADYGLFEFTTFAWRHPRRLEFSAGPDWWSA